MSDEGEQRGTASAFDRLQQPAGLPQRDGDGVVSELPTPAAEMTLYLQEVLRYSALKTGLAFVAITVTLIASPTSRRN